MEEAWEREKEMEVKEVSEEEKPAMKGKVHDVHAWQRLE